MSHEQKVHTFEDLLEVVSTLLGPEGCPWDKKQTLLTLRNYLIEEAFEVVDAINRHDTTELKEELGDLLFNVLFLTKVAENEGHFSVSDVIHNTTKKLVRRHPHVFGDERPQNMEEIYEMWERVKAEEKKNKPPKPDADFPTLLQASKYIERRNSFDQLEKSEDPELQVAYQLLTVIQQADKQNINSELALKKALQKLKGEPS